MSNLKEDILIELAKSCIIDVNILSVIRPHLQFSYILGEPLKHVFKYLFDYYDAHKKPPTIGLVSQALTVPNVPNNISREVLSVVGTIRSTNVFDHKDQILSKFEEYIKRSRFIDLQQTIFDLYNKGEQDEAITLNAVESKKIHEFSLKAKIPTKIYGDFQIRQHRRKEIQIKPRKIPTGIPAFDHYTHGGVDLGTGFLATAKSGAGKTTLLRSLGYNASFRGINVLHVASGDSTKEEIEDGYDAMWTDLEINAIRQGDFDGVNMKQIDKLRKSYIANCGEIFIHVFNQFHSATILDVRSLLIDIEKSGINIGLILFDYLEKFDPGDGRRYPNSEDGTRLKKMATAEKIVNIATEFDKVTATVTQASNIDKERWNNPSWVITRENISDLKATINPFAYHITLNQTEDENDNEEMRIHMEKLRHYPLKSWFQTFYIKQDRARGRFIDLAETKSLFWDDEAKRILNNKRMLEKSIKKAK